MQFWKWFFTVLAILLFAAGVFLLTAFIISTKNNVQFVDLLKDWFGKEQSKAMIEFVLNKK